MQHFFQSDQIKKRDDCDNAKVLSPSCILRMACSQVGIYGLRMHCFVFTFSWQVWLLGWRITSGTFVAPAVASTQLLLNIKVPNIYVQIFISSIKDAMFLSWNEVSAYAFPPFQFFKRSVESFFFSDHSYFFSLAKTSMVHRSSAIVLRKCTPSSTATKPVVSIQRKCTASSSGKSASSRMVTLREGLCQKDVPQGASTHSSKAVRQFSETVYDAKWSIVSDWCSRREIDPINVTVHQ